MKRTDMSVWVPIISCDEDIQFHLGIQDLMDCVLGSRKSALEFIENLKKEFKEEWSEFSDVSPYNVVSEVTKENCNWYGWEFIWTTEDKTSYNCAIFLQLTPIFN